MATAAPPLINDYVAASAAQKQAMVPAFATLYRAVVLGMKGAFAARAYRPG